MDEVSITIEGIAFSVPRRYAAGHMCTAAEAQALQSTMQDNLRNNFAKRVKAAQGKQLPGKALQPAMVVQLQRDFAAYAAGYCFGGARGDPAAKMARQLASVIVAEWMNKRGLRRADMAEAEYEERIASTAALPAVQQEASRRLAALSALAQEALL